MRIGITQPFKYSVSLEDWLKKCLFFCRLPVPWRVDGGFSEGRGGDVRVHAGAGGSGRRTRTRCQSETSCGEILISESSFLDMLSPNLLLVGLSFETF